MNDRQGRIITFYTYKGGCGRTMALANVAWILASNGHRVLTVDWDLEAPGLDKFYRPFIDQAALGEHLGVSYLITNYQSAIIHNNQSTGRRLPPSRIAERFTRLEEHVIPVGWDFPDEGRLDFLPAGASNREYGTGMSGFDWDRFTANENGDEFTDALRSAMRRDYDYTLIDSRTGLHDVGDLCTGMLPDTVVVGFALSDQSIEGASDVAQRVSAYDYDDSIRILPVPMRIEDAEVDKRDAGLAKAHALFGRYIVGGAPREYWGRVQIPYKTFYAYEEVLAAFGDQPGQPGSLLAACERLTGEISSGVVTALPPMPEQERADFLKTHFTRRMPTEPAEILLSYVSEDRPWAEWLSAALEGSGTRVQLQRDVEAAGMPEALDVAVKSAKRVVALVSDAYRKSARYEDLVRVLSRVDPSKTRQLVVPCRVDPGNPAATSQLFATRISIELDQLDHATANRQLGQILEIPLQTTPSVRYPGAKPDVWFVPEKNPNFTGRARIIDSLREQMMAGKTMTLQALHATGGFGKTQIALEYADRFKSSYDIVWWIRSEDPNRAVEAMAALGAKLGLKAANDVAVADLVKDSLRRGEPYKRALLVFDNAPDTDTITSLLPTGGDTHVLITTRDREVGALGLVTLNVDTFERDESIALLRRHVRDIPEADAFRLAEALNDMPIEIDTAGKYIEQTAISVDDYLARVREPASGAVWQTAIDQVAEVSPAAVRMMELFAFFGGEPVDRSILYSDQFAQVLAEYDETLSVDRALLGDYAGALNRFGLIRIDQVHGFNMHRALQEWLRPRLAERGVADRARISVQRILARSRPSSGDTDDPENRIAFGRIWPHLAACDAGTSDDQSVRQLMLDQVRHLTVTGQLSEAEHIARELLETWTDESGEGRRTVLRLRFLLANVIRSTRARESYEIDMAVMEGQKAILTPPDTHPDVLNTMASVGADLRALGRFQEALDIDGYCYEVTRKSNEQGRAALRAAHNYALSLAVTGQCYAARDLDRQLYDEEKKIFGYEHPWTLNTAINLGRDLRDCGDFAGATRLLEAAHRRCVDQRGEHDPHTLESAKALAVVYRKTGRHEDGLTLTQSVVDAFESVLGRDNPDTLACKLNLACDWSAANEREQALEIALGVRDKYATLLDNAHPHTLAAANNASIYLRTTGKPDKALALGQETVASLKRLLGDRHMYTMYCEINLANATADCGGPEEALAMVEDTHVRLSEVLGRDHPSSLVAAGNRAVLLRELKRPEAESARSSALRALSGLLGDSHATVRNFQRWALANRDLEPYRM